VQERTGLTLFLLDLNLPDSDGLATSVPCVSKLSVCAIVVLTGNSDEQMALATIQQGAQDYLVKGQIEKNMLVRSIKYAIERKQTEEALRASQQIIEGIINAIPVRVFWKVKNLVYLGCNAAFGARCGICRSEDASLGKMITDDGVACAGGLVSRR